MLVAGPKSSSSVTFRVQCPQQIFQMEISTMPGYYTELISEREVVGIVEIRSGFTAHSPRLLFLGQFMDGHHSTRINLSSVEDSNCGGPNFYTVTLRTERRFPLGILPKFKLLLKPQQPFSLSHSMSVYPMSNSHSSPTLCELTAPVHEDFRTLNIGYFEPFIFQNKTSKQQYLASTAPAELVRYEPNPELGACYHLTPFGSAGSIGVISVLDLHQVPDQSTNLEICLHSSLITSNGSNQKCNSARKISHHFKRCYKFRNITAFKKRLVIDWAPLWSTIPGYHVVNQLVSMPNLKSQKTLISPLEGCFNGCSARGSCRTNILNSNQIRNICVCSYGYAGNTCESEIISEFGRILHTQTILVSNLAVIAPLLASTFLLFKKSSAIMMSICIFVFTNVGYWSYAYHRCEIFGNCCFYPTCHPRPSTSINSSLPYFYNYLQDNRDFQVITPKQINDYNLPPTVNYGFLGEHILPKDSENNQPFNEIDSAATADQQIPFYWSSTLYSRNMATWITLQKLDVYFAFAAFHLIIIVFGRFRPAFNFILVFSSLCWLLWTSNSWNQEVTSAKLSKLVIRNCTILAVGALVSRTVHTCKSKINPHHNKTIHNKLALAAVFCALATISWFLASSSIGNPEYYWFWHSLWHIFIESTPSLVILDCYWYNNPVTHVHKPNHISFIPQSQDAR